MKEKIKTTHQLEKIYILKNKIEKLLFTLPEVWTKPENLLNYMIVNFMINQADKKGGMKLLGLSCFV